MTRYCDGRPPAGWQRLTSPVLSHGRAIVEEGLPNGFKLQPNRYLQWHQCPNETRNSDKPQEELACIASTICRDCPADLVPTVGRMSSTMNGATYKANFLMPGSRCAASIATAPDDVPHYKSRPTRFTEERCDVFDLALHRVGRGITTCASRNIRLSHLYLLNRL
jgi:hypothetical protein